MKVKEDNGFIEPENLISCVLTAFFTTRSAGDNAGVIAERYNFSKDNIYLPIQKHTDNIHILGSGTEPVIADAVITEKKGILIGVQVADCVPILLYDRLQGVIAAVHAGWRGTLREIAPKAVTLAMRNYAISLDKLKFIFMPSIQKCCYEVSSEVAVLFRNHQRNNKGQLTIDIAQENKIQLTELGIPEQNIQISKECTYCYPGFDYPSFRKDGRIRRRMVNFIVRC